MDFKEDKTFKLGCCYREYDKIFLLYRVLVANSMSALLKIYSKCVRERYTLD